MNICAKCHRPLKNPSVNGLGPVCAKYAQSISDVERDLFGFDIDTAVLAAQARLVEFIDLRAWQAQRAISDAFRETRKQLVWVRP